MSSLKRRRPHRPRVTFTAVLLGVWFAACTDDPMHDPADAQRLTPDAAVQIALLRHLIDEGGDVISGYSPGRSVVCVEFLGTEEDASIFRHFAERLPPVRPISECRSAQWDNDPTSPLYYLVHVPSGRAAVQYTLGPIDYDEKDGARASVGYYSGGLSAGSWKCRLQKAEGWSVVECEGQESPY